MHSLGRKDSSIKTGRASSVAKWGVGRRANGTQFRPAHRVHVGADLAGAEGSAGQISGQPRWDRPSRTGCSVY